MKLATWLQTEAPDAEILARCTQLCCLIGWTEAKLFEDDARICSGRYTLELYFDRKTDMLYGKRTYSDERVLWSTTDPNCRGIFG